MSLNPGTKLGPYEILAPLGAGGMGEVYKAKDTRLDRTVAIKVLPSHVASNPEVRQRFEREARAVSSLNHPHICTLYDIGSENGIDFMVMEHIEGDTLADRLKKGALPLEQALRHGIEIADALDKAHRQGVVHRDLKPGNIMLAKSGAKLLDFGLAKITAQQTNAAGLSALPTEAKPLTQEGSILGTFQYMAPEQLEGKEADARTDIFAFGAVFYEMVTGKRAFQGKSQASLIGAIMESDPPALSSLQPMTPLALGRVVESCLAKDPEDRWQDASDLGRQLQWILEEGGHPDVRRAESAGIRRLVPWAVAGIAFLMAIVSIGTRDPLSPNHVPTRFAVPVDGELPSRVGTLVALSPDGRELVYVAITEEGDQLYHRSMNRLEAVALPGTEEARAPFFSPDGQWVAFSSGDRRLKKVSLAGGPPTTICDCIPNVDGAWGPDGTIVFSDVATGILMRVSSDGGIPEPITTLAQGETSHDSPAFVPSGEAVLFMLWSSSLDDARLAVVSLSTGEQRLLGDGFFPRYASTGHLIYGQAGAVWAVRFDADRLEMTGVPVQVLEGVRVEGGGSVQFDFAENGAAVYIAGGLNRDERTLVWVDREGREEALNVPRRAYQAVSISPDGTRIALEVLGSGLEDLWLYDVRGQRASQLTFDAAYDLRPVWMPDGERVLFLSRRGGASGLFSKRADGTGQPEHLVSFQGRPLLWSIAPDGRTLAYHVSTPETGWDLHSVALEGEPQRQPLLAGDFQETNPEISPDGRWLAYASDESGQREIYVSPFPNPAGGKWRVSRDGGTEPVWSADGRELFYRDGSAVLAVSVDTSSAFASGEPQLLFTGPYYRTALHRGHTYDVTPDGQKFVMIRESETDIAGSEIIVIQHWFEELKRLVPK